MKRAGQEASALWTELFGSPPETDTDTSSLIQRLIENLPSLSYDRFTTPALQDSDLVWPLKGEAGRAPNRP